MIELWSPSYPGEAAGTTYPFADTASLAADTGYVLDRDCFLDALLYPVGGAPRLGIAAIGVTAIEIQLVLGDSASSARASAVFDPANPPTTLRPVDAAGRAAGLLVADPTRLAGLRTWPAGTHKFALGAAEFVASCTVPVPVAGVLGVKVGDKVMTGDVWFVGEGGIVITKYADTVRVDAVGDPLSRRAACGPAAAAPRFVRTINNIPPDASGRWRLAVASTAAPDTTLRLVPEAADRLALKTVGPAPGD